MPRVFFKILRDFFQVFRGVSRGGRGAGAADFFLLFTEKWAFADVMTFFALHLILGGKRISNTFCAKCWMRD